MNLKTITLAFGLLPLAAFGQNEEKKPSFWTESQSLVGLWQQTGAFDGEEIVPVTSSNYKVINADGTFYCLVAPKSHQFKVVLYGTYTVDSDSTYTEHIVKHGAFDRMDGTTSKLRYRVVDSNTLLIQFYNETMKGWVPESWKRVKMINDGHNGQRKEL